MIVRFRNVVVLEALRTPIGRFGKSLKDLHPSILAAELIKEALKRLDLKPEELDLVALGNVVRCGLGQLTAKQALIRAGLPPTIETMNIDMVCSSGMASIEIGALHISHGSARIAVVGGMESMSYTPLILSNRFRWGVQHLTGRSIEIIDSMVYDGLSDPFTGYHMGKIADLFARRRGFTREELDLIAFESHMRAAKARDHGLFKDEIIPLKISIEGTSIELASDEGIRDDTSLEKLSKLKPVFTPEGPHTAGNSSQLSDGASILILADENYAKERGFKAKARILGFSGVDTDPMDFPGAPIPAVLELLKSFSLRVSDIDLFENNEAFAVSTAVFTKDLEVSRDKLNIFGGAIALGHPIGATGARITTTLINALRIRNLRYGVASLCHGLGGATALLIERL
ncbi:MAG: thiolase family protein [Sulfolobales archaeon]